MNCRNAGNAIRSIIAETATAQETAAFQKHLIDCSRCSRLYSGLIETAALLTRLPSPVVSAEFDAKFARRLRAANTSLNQPRRIGTIMHSDWLWTFAAGTSAIFFTLIQAQLPKEAEEPLSFSRINALAMLAIIIAASMIIRKVLESDFRLSGVFRRAK